MAKKLQGIKEISVHAEFFTNSINQGQNDAWKWAKRKYLINKNALIYKKSFKKQRVCLKLIRRRWSQPSRTKKRLPTFPCLFKELNHKPNFKKINAFCWNTDSLIFIIRKPALRYKDNCFVNASSFTEQA